MMPRPAPLPYTCEPSGKPGSNGDFNLYICDASGRKIAAVWGRRGEKEATASLFLAGPKAIDVLRALVATGGNGAGFLQVREAALEVIAEADGPLFSPPRQAGEAA